MLNGNKVMIETNLKDSKNTRELKKIFIKTYNDVSNIINERLNSWNSEWFSVHPGPIEDGTKKWIDYGDFIVNKIKCVGQEVYDKDQANPIGISAISINGNPVLIGVLVTDMSKYFYFKRDVQY